MTFLHDTILQNDAIFIADSHFKQGDRELLDFFAKIPKNKQVFLMGDIFHLLIGSMPTSCMSNHSLIHAIATLSQTNEVIFLEGNHDFFLQNIWDNSSRDDGEYIVHKNSHTSYKDTLLKSIVCDSDEKNFRYKDLIQNYTNNEYGDSQKNSKKRDIIESQEINDECSFCSIPIKIYSYNAQPLIIKTQNNHYCILSHGDLWISSFYHFYRHFINNPIVLFTFEFLDKITYGIIYKRFANRINHRLIAEFSFFRSDFNDFLSKRLAIYYDNIIMPLIQEGFARDSDKFYIIEGHFHLGKSLNKGNIFYNSLYSSFFHKKYFSFNMIE
ncbi:hypothetical protein CQA53_05015 [Helicobacter didelphidarum]|uniref:Calcineurin-like phosphoesterase domain-containing protein n=1 Tax=Helicobacter didelphidarum TaxID=2040648 RepID=A0A3D8IMX1_9HELI|nr:metallophosphoesterase [Helicobacter didelphidarum]RDU65984.1 hypothetical protein CQA53_05015 [Helicobacter didelphidarum]